MSDRYQKIYLEAIKEIEPLYKKGTLEHVRLNHPFIYKHMLNLEAKINSLWLNQGPEKEFRKALDEYLDIIVNHWEIKAKKVS
jgi:hypothetical protein